VPSLTGYKPEGAFCLSPGVNGTNVALRLLKETEVYTTPGETFGVSCTNALQLSCSTSLENIERAFERMIPWLENQDFE
jgi:aminotransferase